MMDSEHDRWKTNPDYSKDQELDKTIAAYEALDDHYTPQVIADFTDQHYKPGDKVKWLGPRNEQLEGVVIGGYVIDAFPVPTWVVLNDGQIVEVDEIVLLYEWDVPS